MEPSQVLLRGSTQEQKRQGAESDAQEAPLDYEEELCCVGGLVLELVPREVVESASMEIVWMQSCAVYSGMTLLEQGGWTP